MPAMHSAPVFIPSLTLLYSQFSLSFLNFHFLLLSFLSIHSFSLYLFDSFPCLLLPFPSFSVFTIFRLFVFWIFSLCISVHFSTTFSFSLFFCSLLWYSPFFSVHPYTTFSCVPLHSTKYFNISLVPSIFSQLFFSSLPLPFLSHLFHLSLFPLLKYSFLVLPTLFFCLLCRPLFLSFSSSIPFRNLHLLPSMRHISPAHDIPAPQHQSIHTAQTYSLRPFKTPYTPILETLTTSQLPRNVITTFPLLLFPVLFMSF